MINTSELDIDIELGHPVGGLFRGSVQTGCCRTCSHSTTSILLDRHRGVDEPAWCPLPCDNCGLKEVSCRAWLRDKVQASPPSQVLSPPAEPSGSVGAMRAV